MSKPHPLKPFAITILSIMFSGFVGFLGWIVTDIQAESKINAQQDVKIEYIGANIIEIKKDLKILIKQTRRK